MNNTATNNLKTLVQAELIKRGFKAKLIQFEVCPKYNIVRLQSEDFQTTPVIFEKLNITHFNGGISKETIIVDDYDIELEVTNVWIAVHVAFTHTDGGFNSTKLFDVRAVIDENDEVVSIHYI